MEGTTTKPQARRDGIVATRAGDDLVIYDSERQRAHCLNSTVARVWEHCNGEHSVAGLARVLGPSYEAIVVDALAELEEHGLLAPSSGLNRRQLIGRGGMVAAAVGLAVPAITSIALPDRAAAASACIPNGASGCNTDDDCCEDSRCGPPGNVCIGGTCSCTS